MLLSLHDATDLGIPRLVLLRTGLHPGRPVRTAHPDVELSLRRDPRSVARRHQSARHGPGLHHPAVADSPARLQFRHPESLRRAPRPRADCLRVLPPGRRRLGHPTHRAGDAIRRSRQQRHRGLAGICPARLDAARHGQKSGGQLQLPVAGRAAPQLRPARRRDSCHCWSWVRWCSWHSSGCRMRP